MTEKLYNRNLTELELFALAELKQQPTEVLVNVANCNNYKVYLN